MMRSLLAASVISALCLTLVVQLHNDYREAAPVAAKMLQGYEKLFMGNL